MWAVETSTHIARCTEGSTHYLLLTKLQWSAATTATTLTFVVVNHGCYGEQ